MYEHSSRQIAFHDEHFFFGGLSLNPDNRWVKLACLVVEATRLQASEEENDS
ncbi:MAG: hypothetical protein ACOX4A_00385 [Saccharofermentanales bacterium]|jgi:hypothetical protein